MVGLLMDVWRNSIRKKWDLPHFKQPKLEKTQNPVVPARFELADAVLLPPSANRFAALSLCPAFRRRWPSVYEALEDGRPDREGLPQLYVSQMPDADRPLLVGDHTPWPRLSARTLRDRTCVHQSTPIRGNKPITLGHDYSTIAWIAPDEGGRASPLLDIIGNKDSSEFRPFRPGDGPEVV